METKATPLGTELCPMRTAPGRTHSGRRPSPEVPRPDGINHSSSFKSKSIDTPRLRADYVRPAETCEKPASRVFRPPAAIETRIYTSRGRAVKQVTAPSRTYSDSRHTCRTSDTIKNLFGLCPYKKSCRPDDFRFHRSGGTVFLNLFICAKVHVHE